MWYYKLNNKRYSNGVWKISDNYTNGENIEKNLLLEYDKCGDWINISLTKSAILSWFNDKYNYKNIFIMLCRGYNVMLRVDNKTFEYNYKNFFIRHNYLLYVETYNELKELDKKINRSKKIKKLTNVVL